MEGIIQLPRPPPSFDIEKRRRLVGVLDGGVAEARRVRPPAGRAIKEWIPDEEPDLDWFNHPRNPQGEWASRPHEYESNDGYPDPDGIDQSPRWKPEEIQLDDCRTLVLEYT